MKKAWMKHDSLILMLKANYDNCFQALTQNDNINLSYRKIFILVISAFCLFFVAMILGYRFAFWSAKSESSLFEGSLHEYIESDRHQVKDLQFQTEQHLQVLTQHLGRIEANLMRINALGERLVESARLDPNEFNFNQEVGVGGPSDRELPNDTLLSSLKELDALLERRYAQLFALNQAVQVRVGQRELSFSGAGKAVAKGWISSFFGHRHDPFTGRKSWHAGVDIVGKEGSEIKALASGIVSYANVKGAYGRLVEIKHADGLATRYGHTKEILVKSGQLVRKGDTIALLGSSGRSTGPHLHLEVHKDGKPVDPGQYFPDLKRR